MASPFPPTLTVTTLHDPVIDAIGFEPTDHYLELCWLPVVGPSCLWTYRRLTAQLAHRDPFTIELAFLAEAMGLGTGTGASSPIMHTLERLARFGLAARPEDAAYAVRPRAPWLPAGMARRLHPELQRAHRALLADHEQLRRRAG